MSNKAINWILFGSIFGIIVGAAGGYYFPDILFSLGFLGKLFINALKVIITPLIITSLIVGITSLGDIKKFSRAAGTTIIYFLSTTIVAVVTGIILLITLQPGLNVEKTGAYFPKIIQELRTTDSMSIIESIIPSNIPKAVIEGNYLGIIFITIIFALVLTNMSRQGKIVVDFLRAINDVLYKIINIILLLLPIGLLVIIGNITADSGESLNVLLNNLFPFAGILLIGFLIHGLIVLPVALKFIGHSSPVKSFKNMLPAISTAFGTGSSTAALPVTMDCAINRNNVDHRAGSLVLPLGSSINIDGTAMYAVMAVIFIAQMFGVSLSLNDILIMGVLSVFLSFGLSALPHATMFLVVILMDYGNFPPEAYSGIGLLLLTDWFFERLRASLNVWGDSVGASIIGETFAYKTARPYNTDKKYQRTDSKFSKPSYSRERQSREDSRKSSATNRYQKSEQKTRTDYDSDKRKRPSRRENQPIQETSPFEMKPVENGLTNKPIKKEEPKEIKKQPPAPMPKPPISTVPKPPDTLPFVKKDDRIKTEQSENKKTPLALTASSVEDQLSKVAERLAVLDKLGRTETDSAPDNDNHHNATIDFIDQDSNQTELIENRKTFDKSPEFDNEKPETPVYYGRSTRKKKIRNDETTEESAVFVEKGASSGYDLEKQSFGRSPKKKST